MMIKNRPSSIALNRRQFLGAAGTLMGLGCRKEAMQGAFSDQPPEGVILVTLDTLRADHLACHGYPRETAPFLSSLAKKGVVFEEALAATSHTAPSHASILTGLHMMQHRFLYNGQAALSPEVPTMAELFQQAGYQTAGFPSVLFLEPLARGFDHFEYSGQFFTEEGDTEGAYLTAPTQVDRVVRYLKKNASKGKFFLWLHLFDPHTPLEPQQRHLDAIAFDSEQERQQMIQYWMEKERIRVENEVWRGDRDRMAETLLRYDAEIHFADAELRRLSTLNALMQRDILWVITADHGHGFGAHDYRGHGREIYQEQVHAPLLIYRSKGAFPAQRRETRVHHLDLLPTFAEMIRQNPVTNGFTHTGRSLLPALQDPAYRLAQAPLFTERRISRLGDASEGWEEKGPMYAWFQGAQKYIQRNTLPSEAYDLAQDPYEEKNVLAQDPGAWKTMAQEAQDFHKMLFAQGEKAREEESNAAYNEQLDALGYL